MSCQIYCIEDCNQLKYVGSTIYPLNKRLLQHKSQRSCSSKKLDLDNCKIYQLETCDISHRKEREKYWINNIDCVNERKLNFDSKEYNKKYGKKYGKKYRKKYGKKYRDKEYQKKYREYRKSCGDILKIDVNLFLN